MLNGYIHRYYNPSRHLKVHTRVQFRFSLTGKISSTSKIHIASGLKFVDIWKHIIALGNFCISLCEDNFRYFQSAVAAFFSQSHVLISPACGSFYSGHVVFAMFSKQTHFNSTVTWLCYRIADSCLDRQRQLSYLLYRLLIGSGCNDAYRRHRYTPAGMTIRRKRFVTT